MRLEFNAAPTAPLQTYVHSTDDIVCRDETTWIVHQVPMEPLIIVRRYAADGTLLRFVESPLPTIVTPERYTFVDSASVHETDGAIWFDRIEVEHRKKFRSGGIVGRDTFRIPLAERR